ncbi:MAG: VWA domain-containing protein [Bacteroidetes bacterium]|nr:MAG: VWA domain-containing protein [Bacteroidota bacterium]MBL1144678.1 VWA domain-containing protein [Bacteroidota bacterium]
MVVDFHKLLTLKASSMKLRISLGLLVLFMVFSSITHAQSNPQKTRILFVLDGSQSMYARWDNGSKMQIATRLLRELVDSLSDVPNIELALRAYGHQYNVSADGRNCKDTKLEVPFSPKNHDKIKSTLRSIQPKGTTLIAYSLEQAANDFPTCSDCRNVIILITDGIEECDGDPCAVSLALQKKGVILKPFVIGLGLDPQIMDAFKCIGNFFDAKSESTFRNVLGIVISQALNNTTAQVNLLDILNKPTETNVAMTFYDAFSGSIRYNFIHTIDSRGNPDTIPIDPLGNYNLTVHTIPPVEKKDIKLTAGKHNIIAVDAPQGDLVIKMNGFNEYKDLKAIVRKHGEDKTLVIQDFDRQQRYLVGKYDLEILTLPRTYVENVNIAQSNTTKVEIPQAGMVSIGSTSKGYGSIFLEKEDKLVWVCNISESSTRESIVLQPGSYRIVYRPLNAKQSIYTKEQSFTIQSGQSTQVKL